MDRRGEVRAQVLLRVDALALGALVLTLMFAMFGAMFFMTFYMENVHGLDAVDTGVRLLPMTGMLIVGSPLSGFAITRFGPCLPMVVGMLLAAGALFGLSRTVGVAPVAAGTPAQTAAAITDVVHSTFISGMTASFLVASFVAIGGALIALLTKKGENATEGAPAMH